MTDQVQIGLNAETILQFLHRHRDELRAMGVTRIGLFGSYVRGEQRPESDIDFLVEMRSPSYRDFMNLRHFLEDQFERKIDLGEEHLLKPIARPHILQEVKYVEGF